jgi:hypothetical protein
MQDNVIRIGKYTHHLDRLGLDSWSFGRAAEDFRALWREADAYAKLREQLHRAGKLTAEGVRDQLRKHVADVKLGALMDRAAETAGLARNAPAAKRASLRQSLDAKRDMVRVALRVEMRAFLRGLPEGERIQLALDPAFADAVVEQPARVSGIPADLYGRVEMAALEAAFPGALKAAEAEAASGEAVQGALEGLRAQLAEDGAIDLGAALRRAA